MAALHTAPLTLTLTLTLVVALLLVAATPLPSALAQSEPVGSVGVQLVAENFVSPVGLVSAPGDDRLFVIDQVGLIWAIRADGQVAPDPFLDVRDRMVALAAGYDERGLLGLAFHPGFAQNGRVFAFYSAPLREGAPSGWDHTGRLSEFSLAAGGRDRLDSTSEKVLYQVDEPQPNHNGATILFGPDGMLYLSLGDGGGQNDQGRGHSETGNGQNLGNPLGKILRFNVEGQTLSAPPDNPFAGGGGLPEIWAYGLRNPYRMSFDRETGELFAGDAGQNLYEEIDLIVKGGNYGWRIREGAHCFDPGNPRNPPAECPTVGAAGEPLIDPIVEFGHDLGVTAVGGNVYRGKAISDLVGKYVFTGYSIGSQGGLLLAASRPTGGAGPWPFGELKVAGMPGERIGAAIAGFGEDNAGELYVCTKGTGGPSGQTGKVYRLVPAG